MKIFFRFLHIFQKLFQVLKNKESKPWATHYCPGGLCTKQIWKKLFLLYIVHLCNLSKKRKPS